MLDAGTAGTMVVNKLRRRLDRFQWQITIVDQNGTHLYQPGLLFVPFGQYQPDEIVRPRSRCMPDGVDLVQADIDRVDPQRNMVVLTTGRELGYDYLIVATGVKPAAGSDTGDARSTVAQQHLRLLYPRRCDRPGRGAVELRQRPTRRARTQPIASAHLASMLIDRKITVESDFLVERIDTDTKTLISYDECEVPFDLLVTVPLNMGADYIARSNLGDELNYVPVDRNTFLSRAHAKAHFSVEIFADNFCEYAEGRAMTGSFDGHANCFVESGDGKGLLIDFNYDTEPLTGTYPLPVLGPFRLLAENSRNHWGKLAFRWMYWHLLLPGRPIPLPAHMSMAGKHQPAAKES